MNIQNEIERLNDLFDRGIVSTEQANVILVRIHRVLVVKKMSKDIRAILNEAVKKGDLGYLKKDGPKPAVYFHPDFIDLAHEKRNAQVNATIRAKKSITSNTDDR